jgi:hypothetical protein
MGTCPGCSEWGPPGAGAHCFILGAWWWVQCPSGPIDKRDMQIQRTYIHIDTHTYSYMHVPKWRIALFCEFFLKK